MRIAPVKFVDFVVRRAGAVLCRMQHVPIPVQSSWQQVVVVLMMAAVILAVLLRVFVKVPLGVLLRDDHRSGDANWISKEPQLEF